VFRFGEVEVDRTGAHGAARGRGGAPHADRVPVAVSVLAAHAGRVLTHRQLLREVWGPSHTDQSHYLRIYMGHLRQKLEADPAQPGTC
jgi:two-component system KDP operon response regulator KdpE